MKKNISVILIVAFTCLAMFIAGCGGTSSDKKPADKDAGSGKNRVVIYTAAEDERIAYLQDNLNKKFPDTQIVIQSLGTGQLLSKLQAEGKNTECDIFYDLEVVNAEIILNAVPDLFADLSKYDFSIYDGSVTGYTSRHHKYAVNGKTYGAFLVNNKVLKAKNLPIPATYKDMLKPEYKGLISVPSPKSSGTGYSLYNGVLSILGDKEGMKFFEDLNPNVKEYTTSGSAPSKAAVRGDVAIAFGLLWQCVLAANTNKDMTVVIPDKQLPFDLFTMGMIAGHDTKGKVKDVFTYLFNELNKPQCAKFNPDKIYVNMPKAEIANYPTGFGEISMKNLFDVKYKQNLLDQWKY